MANLEEKRIKLFNDFRNNAEKENLLNEFNKKYPYYSSWESINFKDEASVLSIWDKAIRDIIAPTSREKFFQTFACDLDWAKTTKYCGAEQKKETEKAQGQQDKPVEKPNVTQQQQNLVAKGYFIGTSGPNKNGVDGVPGEKTQYAQHALDSGIDATTYNNNYKQLYPDLTQTIENLFGKQTPNEIPDNPKLQPKDDSNNKKVQPDDDSNNKKVQVQKARVIKTINPNDW